MRGRKQENRGVIHEVRKNGKQGCHKEWGEGRGRGVHIKSPAPTLP